MSAKFHKGARGLGSCLPATTSEAMRKRGFGEFRLLNEWERVVGAHLAAYSAPIKIVFERGKNTHGALHIQVASAMALEFQHLQPIILERINTYFGYSAIARLMLLQTQSASFLPVPEKTDMPVRVMSPATSDTLIPLLAACEDEQLRARLLSLAQTVFSTSSPLP